MVRPEKAIEILYERYADILIILAESYVHDRKAAEDIVQETFIHIWEQHRKLGQPDDRSIEHYLVRVVRNKAITCYNKQVRQNRVNAVQMNGYGQPEVSVEARWIDLEINRQIRSIILTFPGREKQCLLMKLDDEFTTQQIAESLSVTRKAVERSLTSAYKRLRKCLKRKGYAIWPGRQRTTASPSTGSRISKDT